MVEIRNEKVVAKINTNGAELIELSKIDGKNVLWKKDEQIWNRIAPNLFPIVGRLKDDQFRYDGKVYSMSQHGFARNRTFQLIEKSELKVIFRLYSDEITKKEYPFDFIFDVQYQLIESVLHMKYRVENRGEELLPYSVGGHPGFAIEEKLTDYYLDFGQSFSAKQWLLEGPYYSGETVNLTIDKMLELVYSLLEKDAIVIRTPPFNRVILGHKDRGGVVAVSYDQLDAIGFWSKTDAPFFCIEPWWGWADRIDSTGNFLDKEGLHFLNPTEQKEHSFCIELL
ncbi:MAG: aldose 1-epimerase family protein [Bacteroidetes bacterium]|nr:aldose 1-epimerase family protein [Bacteroidota bacterium]